MPPDCAFGCSSPDLRAPLGPRKGWCSLSHTSPLGSPCCQRLCSTCGWYACLPGHQTIPLAPPRSCLDTGEGGEDKTQAAQGQQGEASSRRQWVQGCLCTELGSTGAGVNRSLASKSVSHKHLQSPCGAPELTFRPEESKQGAASSCLRTPLSTPVSCLHQITA